MSTVSPKRAMFEQLAAVAKAMGHAHRLELLELLAQGDRTVEAVAERAGLSVANASQHLQQLRRAGLVNARKEGKHVRYCLTDDAVVAALAALRRLAERHVEEAQRVVSGYFSEPDGMEPVTHKELLQRLRDGLVTVVDVRPADEFAAGHLPQAINIPLKDLKRRLRELPPEREIIAYCRGPYCVLALDAVAALRKRGFKARRLEDGLPEWRLAGLPIEAA